MIPSFLPFRYHTVLHFPTRIAGAIRLPVYRQTCRYGRLDIKNHGLKFGMFLNIPAVYKKNMAPATVSFIPTPKPQYLPTRSLRCRKPPYTPAINRLGGTPFYPSPVGNRPSDSERKYSTNRFNAAVPYPFPQYASRFNQISSSAALRAT